MTDNETIAKTEPQDQEHTIEIVHAGGEEMLEAHQAVCTCGWKGQKYEAYNNWKWSNINDTIADHRRAVSGVVHVKRM